MGVLIQPAIRVDKALRGGVCASPPIRPAPRATFPRKGGRKERSIALG